MNPEELFNEYKHLVKETLIRYYKSPRKLAQQHKIELEDLYSYGFTGLWKACITFDPTKAQIKTYAISNIKWHINERLKRECHMFKLEQNRKYKKDEIHKINYLDSELKDSKNEGLTYHEIIPSDKDTFEEVSSNLEHSRIFNALDDKEQRIISLKLQDKSNKEVGDILGMTGSNVSYLIKKMRNKVSELLDGEVVGA